MDQNCETCGGEIVVMAYKNTGYCSANCVPKSQRTPVGTLVMVNGEEQQAIINSRRPGLRLYAGRSKKRSREAQVNG